MQNPENEAKLSRHKHLETHAAAFNELVPKMAKYTDWAMANKRYEQARAEGVVDGSQLSQNKINTCFMESKLEYVRYWAALAYSLESAAETQGGNILTEDQWILLAETDEDKGKTSIAQLTGNERKLALDKYKEEHYGKYKGLITPDQLKRAREAVEKGEEKKKSPEDSYWSWKAAGISSTFDIAPEKEFSESEAEIAANKEIYQEIIGREDIKKIIAEKTKGLSQSEKKEAVDKIIQEEIERIEKVGNKAEGIQPNPTYVSSRVETYKSVYKKNLEDIKEAQQLYDIKLSKIGSPLTIAMKAMDIYQSDMQERDKEHTDKIAKPELEKTIESIKVDATIETKKNMLYDLRGAARGFLSQQIGAGRRSQYNYKLTARHTSVSEEQKKVLEEVPTYKTRLETEKARIRQEGEKKGSTKEEIEKAVEKATVVKAINGIACGNNAIVTLWGSPPEVSKFFGWDPFKTEEKNMQDKKKFFESYMTELAASNNAEHLKYQKEQGIENPVPLKIKDMLQAYAAGTTIKVPDLDANNKVQIGKDGNVIMKDVPNENMKENGQPINVLQISSLPMSGGAKNALKEIFKYMAIAHILGIAININMKLIGENTPSALKGVSDDLQDLWEDHHKLSDPTYGQPTLQEILVYFKLTEYSPEKQREKLIEIFTGSEANRADLVNAAEMRGTLAAGKAVTLKGNAEVHGHVAATADDIVDAKKEVDPVSGKSALGLSDAELKFDTSAVIAPTAPTAATATSSPRFGGKKGGAGGAD